MFCKENENRAFFEAWWSSEWLGKFMCESGLEGRKGRVEDGVSYGFCREFLGK